MPSDYPKSKKEAVGYILKKIGGMLGSPKARRLGDRRASKQVREEPEQDLLVGEGPDSMDTIKKRKVTNGHELIERTPGGWVQGRRFLKDRRRQSKFNIEKRKAKDLGKLALKITPPVVAAATAAGIYSRKNKEKNKVKKNGDVETDYDYTKGGTLKLRKLKPHEIETLFHSGIKNPKINPSAKTKLSGVSKEKARRDRKNTERILRMKR